MAKQCIRTAAIVVTYNRREKLRACIEALKAQTYAGELTIIVVDNNSSDGTREMILGMPEAGIDYHNTGYNSGGAGGFCYGIRKAAEAGYDYLWLMDDDCIPARDALEEFFRAAEATMVYHSDSGCEGGCEDGGFGFLAGRVLWKDGTMCRMNIPRRTVFRPLDVSGPDRDKDIVPVEMASFVSLFIPASVVREVGLPIRRFFIWTDDWEYTRRISMRYPCWMAGGSTAVHDTATNTGADIASARDDAVWRFRYLYRNDVYLYRREGLKGFCYEAARLALHLGRISFSRNTLSEKLRRAGILIHGTIEGFSFFPEPERAK